MKQPHKQLAARTKKDHNVIYIVALGIAIIAIAAISSHFIPQSKKAQEKLKEIQIMQKIVQIDDI
jgi:flagellar basal body-associated protein FliL